jgi:hypothetical protein
MDDGWVKGVNQLEGNGWQSFLPLVPSIYYTQ